MKTTRIGIAVLIMMASIFTLAAVTCASEKIGTAQGKDASLLQGRTIVEPESIIDEELDALMDQKAKEIADKRKNDISHSLSDDNQFNAMSDDYLDVYRMNQYDDIWNGPYDVLYGESDSSGLYTADSQWIYVNRGMLYLYGSTDSLGVLFKLINEDGDTVKSFRMTNSDQDYCSGIYIAKSGWYYVMAATLGPFNAYLKATNAPIFDYKATFLTNNRLYYTGHPTKAGTITYKYRAVSTGAMKVETDASVKVTVTDTTGRVIGTTLNGTYTPTFGVQRGQIYMIRVAWPDTSKDPYAQGTNTLRVINATWTPVAGKTKATAKVLPRGAYRKGLIIAGQNNIGWFKFKPHKNNIKITFAAGTNDKLVWRVYCNNKYVNSSVFYQFQSWQTQSYYGPSNATWYVKVERVNGTSSGRYQVRFQ